MRYINKVFMLFILLTLFAGTDSYAQYQNLGTANRVEIKENPWFAGGMIGGSFSNNGGNFEVAPFVGYKVTPDLSVGTRLTYIYTKYYGISYNDYGASIFTEYRFLDFLFAHVEYEALNVEYRENERLTISSLFVGGGLIQSVGGRGFATISVLYNVLENEYTPYSNPVIRIGFGVGF